MSDYLTSLAARSLNLVALATPRLGSWFEPVVPRVGVETLPTPGAEPQTGAPRGTVSTGSGDALPERKPRAPEAPGSAIPLGLEPRIEDGAITPAPAPIVRMVESRIGPAGPVRVSDAASRDSEPTVAATTREAAPAHPASPTIAREKPPAEPVVELDPRVARAARLNEDWLRHTEDRLSSLERQKPREPTRALPVEGNRDRPTRLPPQTAPRDRPPAAAAIRVIQGDPVEATPAPAVRVTIGRIEVRAVMPSPSPMVTKAPSPAPTGAMSLDEYLKERSGARR